MRNTVVVLCALVATGLSAACSSASSSGGGGTDGGATESGSGGGVDATIDVVDNPDDCVKPGTANNPQGVGGYCNSGGAQCASAGPGGTPTLCSADFSGVSNAWFCTIPCGATTQCGAGATCVATRGGSYCVPPPCLGTLADAGELLAEAGADASVEGGTDGGTGEGAADSAAQDSAVDAGAD